jgi:hypothetical protein
VYVLHNWTELQKKEGSFHNFAELFSSNARLQAATEQARQNNHGHFRFSSLPAKRIIEAKQTKGFFSNLTTKNREIDLFEKVCCTRSYIVRRYGWKFDQTVRNKWFRFATANDLVVCLQADKSKCPFSRLYPNIYGSKAKQRPMSKRCKHSRKLSTYYIRFLSELIANWLLQLHEKSGVEYLKLYVVAVYSNCIWLKGLHFCRIRRWCIIFSPF